MKREDNIENRKPLEINYGYSPHRKSSDALDRRPLIENCRVISKHELMEDASIKLNDFDSEPLLETFCRPQRSSAFKGCVGKCFYDFLGFLYYLKCTLLCNKVSKVERTIGVDGITNPAFFAPNIVKNQKHNIFTLIPKVLYDQFKYFFNLFYLMVALAQFIPQIKVGPLFTYVAPLSLVLVVTIAKEAYDEYKRYLRDKEINSTLYDCFDRTSCTIRSVKASELRVGNIIQLHSNQRVPCDVVLFQAPEAATFLKTDQLDGETDWKLRRPIPQTQSIKTINDLFNLNAWLVIEPPRREIYDFVGTFYYISSNSDHMAVSDTSQKDNKADNGLFYRGKNSFQELPLSQRTILPNESTSSEISSSSVKPRTSGMESAALYSVCFEPLSLENVLWASTVIPCGPVIGIVAYTGIETRSSMNTSKKETKFGIFDKEINSVTKLLFFILFLVSLTLVTFKGLHGIWYVYLTRFMLLLSSIIPISLRVNVDLARTYYTWLISSDSKMSQTVVRNSSIPEELGRIDIILTDKTGTLTCNDMVFKKLHTGHSVYNQHNVGDLRKHLSFVLSKNDDEKHQKSHLRPENEELLRRTMLSLALCHTVTPVQEESSNKISFQASSPDEIALTVFSSNVGLQLVEALDNHIELKRVDDGESIHFQVLYRFPFSSETKRMGCIVRHVTRTTDESPALPSEANKILFFMKGAESVMIPKLEPRGGHWLQEECDNFARTGLRTLVFAVKELSEEAFEVFSTDYSQAQQLLQKRKERVQAVVDNLASNMTLLGLTGVEDKLQRNVPETLEAFRHAGIKVWMLTGDKLETAMCIAVSAGLKPRSNTFTILSAKDFSNVDMSQEAVENFALGPRDSVLVTDGPFLEIALKHFPELFIRTACSCTATVFSRCSPTQKSSIVDAIQMITKKRTCAIGDGGNDVSMIQKANCGIGIVGKEGRQASLAADYSVSEFSKIHRLLFWHGRLSYQRSSKLAQFVIHRGLTIATIQVIFSAVFFFIPMAVFPGWLTVGYATYYTMLPVFSLVLDCDLQESVVFMFPELYGFLRRGRSLSPKTLFAWVWVSVYQGATIMLGAILLFEKDFTNIVSITFTSLILSELLNVALEVTQWHRLMIIAEVLSVVIYFVSILVLPNYFNHTFISTASFWWKVGTITFFSWVPLCCIKFCLNFWHPTRDSKLTF